MLILINVRVSGQISVISSQTKNIGPGLSIPSTWGTFWGSMNTMIASQDVLISHKDYQYMAYYNEYRKVVIGRRNLCDRNWEFLTLDDYIQSVNDRHNHISIGVCPNDGTIHLAFDHHVDTLNYRISVKGLATYPEQFDWTSNLFSEVRDYLIQGQVEDRVTYPAFFHTHDGHLNMVFRYGGSGNGESYIALYNGISHKWVDVHKFIESTGAYQDPYLEYTSDTRNAYPFYFVYDEDDVLHAAWVWRESSQSRYNHDIAYAKSPDHGKTWINNSGEVIGKVTENDTLYIEYSSPGLHVWTIDSRYGMINNGGMTLDQHGKPHIMAFHRVEPVIQPEPSFVSYNDGRFHHYWSTPDGTWHKSNTTFRGNRPRLYSDSHGNMYMCFIDRTDSTISTSPYILRVVAAEANQAWSNWHQIYQGTYTTNRNEPPADPSFIKQQGVFTVVSHEFWDFHLNGPMFVTDIFTDLEHTSKVHIDVAQDTYVMNGSYSNINFGNLPILMVSDKPVDTLDRNSYLKFNLNKIAELGVIDIQSAMLVLRTVNGSHTYETETYDLFYVQDDGWEETTINWYNTPSTSEFIQSILGDPVSMQWDITQVLLDELAQDSMLSLCIKKNTDTTDAELIFHSRESSASGMNPCIIIEASSSCLQDIGFSTYTQDRDDQKYIPYTVYPNPLSGDYLYILEKDNNPARFTNIEVIDLSGRVIKVFPDNQKDANRMSIDVGNLKNGLYFLRLKSSTAFTTLKFIINK